MNNSAVNTQTVTLANNSATATINANIDNNTITNNGAGDGLRYNNSIAGATTQLEVNDNAPAGVTYEFVNVAGGNFTVGAVDATAANDANPADVTFTGAFNFDDSLVLP